jgi:VWFA-related protein
VRAHCIFWVLLPAILGAQPAAAPDEIRVSSRPYVASSPYSIRVETKLVELSVAVRDSKGHAIRGLKRENFQILDEGKEREIAAFSEEETAAATPSALASAAPAPKAPEPAPAARFVALFFDDINSQDSFDANDLARAQTAAKKFMKEALQPGVRMAVFTISGTVTQDFTNDAVRLTEAIAALKPHPRVPDSGTEHCPKITPYRAYKIAHDHDRATLAVAMTGCAAPREYGIAEAEKIWARVQEASRDTFAAIDRVVGHLGEMPGARVLVMTSSGYFGQTFEPQQHAIIDHAIHAGVVINAMEAKGLYDEPPPFTRPDDPQFQDGQQRASLRWSTEETKALPDRLQVVDSSMADIAHGTGGEFFHNNNDLALGFRELSVPPEVTYRLSFKPEGVAPDGSYHKLKVSLVHAGTYTVETRPGYFAPAEKPADDARSKLESEVVGAGTLSDVPAGLTVQLKKPSANERVLSVIVRVDATKLAFGKQDGRKTQKITFVSALLDAQGKVVTAKEGSMDLALTPETYDRLAKSGLNAELTFQVAPGVYWLREVVQEGVNGSLSSSTNSVDLR